MSNADFNTGDTVIVKQSDLDYIFSIRNVKLAEPAKIIAMRDGEATVALKGIVNGQPLPREHRFWAGNLIKISEEIKLEKLLLKGDNK